MAEQVSTIRRWLMVFPLLIGVVILATLARNRAQPAQVPAMEQAHTVRVIAVPEVTVVPRALGHGTVQPSTVWEAVAEVSGTIIERHPQLKKGALMPADSVLLRIDPTDYELAQAQAQANIRATQAQLAELQVKEANTRASLAIESESLALSQKELERKQQLQTKGMTAHSLVEQEWRSVLAQKQSVQVLQNILNLMPSERQVLEAELARQQVLLASAKRDIVRTTITLPLHSRIVQVNVELHQYVRQGEVLVIADGTERAEVVAQFPLQRLRHLIRSDTSLDLATADLATVQQTLATITAHVTLRGEGSPITWEARLARFSDTLDPQTRTAGMIVEVDDPYRDVQPGVRPPLLKGMFVAVELQGKPRPHTPILPRTALHEQQVYVVDARQRLEKRAITIDLVAPEYVSIRGGLQAGERVVVSDLVPAIDGMLLNPIEDRDSLAQLLRAAGAESTWP